MAAFYPSSIIAMNIDPSTLIFKCIMDPNQFDVCGGDLTFKGITDISDSGATTTFDLGDLAKEVFDNFQTRNILNTASKWLNLPSIDDMYYAVSEKLGD